MHENIVSAEIEPIPDHVNQAASMLQKLGFQIFDMGATISVQGPESLWVSVFNVAFATKNAKIMRDVKGGEKSYRMALTENLKIPAKLKPLIAGVMFSEPPELYF
jgi:hypothetical protein